jgi:hypothetical protein
MSLVFGYAIISALITISSGVSIWYMAFGLNIECLWFFTETLANCSKVVPCIWVCSRPASPNTAGIVPEPSRPSVETPLAFAPPPSKPRPICSTPTASTTS